MKTTLKIIGSFILATCLVFDAAAAVTLSTEQKSKIAQGDKQTVIQVLEAAGVDATDRNAISLAAEQMMRDVATEFKLQASVVEIAAEAVSQGAIDYAVEEGRATAIEVVSVAEQASAAVTEAVVEVAAALKTSNSATQRAVQSASSGTIKGSASAARDAGANLQAVAGAVAKANVQGAAQGAVNTGGNVGSAARAAGNGNSAGASASGSAEVVSGVNSNSGAAVIAVIAAPPAPTSSGADSNAAPVVQQAAANQGIQVVDTVSAVTP